MKFIEHTRTHRVFNFLFFKVKFREKRNIISEGINNTVTIYNNNGEKTSNKFLNSFSIKINGNNNTIILYENENWSNHGNSIIIEGDNNIVKIGKSQGTLYNFKIALGGIYNNRQVVIGDDFQCAGGVIYVGRDDHKVLIGNSCLFSSGIEIRTFDGHKIINIDTNKIINEGKGTVEIKDRVHFCRDVMVLKDSLISEDTVVGTKAIVNKKFYDKNVILAGIPAKIVKTGIRWEF